MMSLKLKGKIVDFLNCLGLKESNDLILKLTTILGSQFTRQEICYIEPQIIYSFYTNGCELCFNKNHVLESIFFYFKTYEKFQVYNNNLINGINCNSSKEKVISIMKYMVGEPEIIGCTDSIVLNYKNYSYIRYKINNKYIHFEYLDSIDLNKITLFIQPA